MKKVMIAGLVALVVAGFAMVSSAAQSYTNRHGQVFTVGVSDDGTPVVLRSTSATTALLRTIIELPSTLQYDPTHSTTNTVYTPRSIGDTLIGFELGTGVVWQATGVTTSDWKRLSN